MLRQVAELAASELAAAVQSLVAREFLHEAVLYPEVEYAFKHALTQEVAYRSQLGERRARIHAAVARAVERLYPDKLDERAALLAYHWEGAGEALRAAEWHARAADWIGTRDRPERVRHWRQVRTLLARVPESTETIALGVLARRNIARLPLVVGLHATGPLGEALRLSEEAEPLGQGTPELAVEVGSNPLGFLLAHRASVFTHMGRFAEAARTAEHTMERARARGDREVLGIALNATSLLRLMTGERERGLHLARQSVENAEALGTALSRALALGALGRAQVATGRWSEAVETLGAALALMRERRTVLYMELINLALLAEAYLGAGDPARARETMSLALEIGRRRSVPVHDIRALLARARVGLAIEGSEGAAEVEATLSHAATLVAATEAHAYTPFIHLERARLSLLTGDEAAHERALREARRLFTDMGATARAEQVGRALVA